ncbi:PKD domain-containing protein [Tellurirhabdus bombi]|uniref:PKD domain-containing protein n=1 Tax=Tellurirhabdus bombi TaxID=2907205 RepID=UPI001F435AC6|nr:PKD domain-containing protein [Tellurirhabdus bombi]
MLKIVPIFSILLLICTSCEPFNLEKKEFATCTKPTAKIGQNAFRLQVEFFVEDPQGDIGAVGWDLGDGQRKIGNRFTYIYTKPGTYTVNLTLANQCNDTFTTTRTITVTN